MSNSNMKIEYLQKYGSGKIFVETGTYHGDTVQIALDAGYETIHSIEFNKELYDKCCERFKDNSKVKLWLGDSVDLIPEIMKEINEPATFWLDAHASGPLSGGKYAPCPLVLELQEILGRKKIKITDQGLQHYFEKSNIDTHTIMIDDRRLFGSAEWGNVQEVQIMDLLFKINQGYNVFYLDGHQADDIICATVRDK